MASPAYLGSCRDYHDLIDLVSNRRGGKDFLIFEYGVY